MVNFDAVALLVSASYADCTVGVPLPAQGLGEMKQNSCSSEQTEPEAG